MNITAMRDRLSRTRLFSCRWYPFLIILLAVVAVYGKTLSFKFVFYDDNMLILNNQSFLNSAHSISSVFSHAVSERFSMFYRPMLMLTFILDAYITAINPLGYHISNVCFHVIACWMFFILLTRWGYSRLPSLFGAVFLAIHPLLVSAVAWIPGRNDSLLAIFVFGAFITLADYVDRKGPSRYWSHVACLTIALFVKETALAVFPVLLAGLFLVRKEALMKYWKTLLPGWLLATAVYFAAWHHTLLRDGRVSSLYLVKDTMTGLSAGLTYLGKMLYCGDLLLLPYSTRMSVTVGIVVLFFLLLSLFCFTGWRSRYMLFGALWMIFFLLPVIIFNNTDIYLDHRAYLPLAGFIVMLIEMCLPFGRTLHLRSAPVALMLSSGIIIAYAVVSFAFCNKFADEKTFWESAAVTGRSSPQYAVIQDALGVVCVKGGKYEEALKCFERSIAVKPTAKAYYDKACTLAIVGDLPAAAKTYRIVLLQNPKSDESRRNLAAIEKYMNTHQWDRQRLKVSVAVK